MEYKQLIFFLILLFVSVMIYKEINSIKNSLFHTIGKMILEMNYNNETAVAKLQNNMTKSVAQIRNISADSLNQLRKITLLNHQPVTKITDHFTEIEESDFNSIGSKKIITKIFFTLINNQKV